MNEKRLKYTVPILPANAFFEPVDRLLFGLLQWIGEWLSPVESHRRRLDAKTLLVIKEMNLC
jgi:hypothetical protein